MKIKNKKLIYSVTILLILMFGFSYGYLNSSTVRVQNATEINGPKSSADEIKIVTPENKSYFGPDSGFYPSTFGFEDDNLSSLGEEISFISVVQNIDPNTEVSIESEVDLHKNVLHISDHSSTGRVFFRNIFTENQTDGIVEFWVRTSGNHRRSYFKIGEDFNQVDLSFTPSGTIDYYDTTWHTIQSINLDEWYHFKIEFNCSANWNLWINNEKKSGSGWDFWGNPPALDRILIATDTVNTNWEIYFDAISYSWDPNYKAGDNMNEGLLLSYENATNLDWKGFSLDGSINASIRGNTTIPMPYDGFHNVQVFGNNTLGTMFESTFRHFTVDTSPPPEISTIYPSAAQEFSEPPVFILSINETNIESLWYTLNGGAEIPFTSETGIISGPAWNALPNGPVTIRFYVRDIADREVYDEVIVVKVAGEAPTPPPGIPGYDLIALIGVCSIITMLMINKYRGGKFT